MKSEDRPLEVPVIAMPETRSWMWMLRGWVAGIGIVAAEQFFSGDGRWGPCLYGSVVAGVIAWTFLP